MAASDGEWGGRAVAQFSRYDPGQLVATRNGAVARVASCGQKGVILDSGLSDPMPVPLEDVAAVVPGGDYSNIDAYAPAHVKWPGGTVAYLKDGRKCVILQYFHEAKVDVFIAESKTVMHVHVNNIYGRTSPNFFKPNARAVTSAVKPPVNKIAPTRIPRKKPITHIHITNGTPR